jgi:tetratricopeptide (TPR) repeat protein
LTSEKLSVRVGFQWTYEHRFTGAPIMNCLRKVCFRSACLCLFLAGTLFAQSGKKPALIRDTEAAEGKESTEAVQPKERDPMLADQNVGVGNFYFKKKNYDAAIQRYLLALEYQPDSTSAQEALARAYEKKGDTAKAIKAYQDFIEKNPGSPKAQEFKAKLTRLEKKS